MKLGFNIMNLRRSKSPCNGTRSQYQSDKGKPLNTKYMENLRKLSYFCTTTHQSWFEGFLLTSNNETNWPPSIKPTYYIIASLNENKFTSLLKFVWLASKDKAICHQKNYEFDPKASSFFLSALIFMQKYKSQLSLIPLMT